MLSTTDSPGMKLAVPSSSDTRRGAGKATLPLVGARPWLRTRSSVSLPLLRGPQIAYARPRGTCEHPAAEDHWQPGVVLEAHPVQSDDWLGVARPGRVLPGVPAGALHGRGARSAAEALPAARRRLQVQIGALVLGGPAHSAGGPVELELVLGQPEEVAQRAQHCPRAVEREQPEVDLRRRVPVLVHYGDECDVAADREGPLAAVRAVGCG
ncbi:unnamed protein product [Prorocentrum cordatum]|uniref:Uncharacterized protein n=1 Tax=Prorocentrum cordatum TaxID=2364126 RepID=A0ABN9W8C4_9DINO|nr:unnamed protein product [Polarella glacialis]